MLLAMDPPRHNDYRRPMVKRFMPKVMEQLEDRIRAITKDILVRRGRDGRRRFRQRRHLRLPTQVIGELVGLPVEDWEHVHHMAELNTHGQDPDYAPDGDGINPGSGSMEMAIYGMQHAARLAHAGAAGRPDDVHPARTEFGGKLMTDLDFGVFFVQLVTAGQDTTQTMLASGLHALLLHPEQLAELRARPQPDPGRGRGDPALLQPAALLPADRDGRHGARRHSRSRPATRWRCTTPRPTATRTSSPTRRRSTSTASPTRTCRSASPQHFCLGVHLARLEGRIFFEELLDAFPTHRADRTGGTYPFEPQQRAQEAPDQARPRKDLRRLLPAGSVPVVGARARVGRRCSRAAGRGRRRAGGCGGGAKTPAQVVQVPAAVQVLLRRRLPALPRRAHPARHGGDGVRGEPVRSRRAVRQRRRGTDADPAVGVPPVRGRRRR